MLTQLPPPGNIGISQKALSEIMEKSKDASKSSDDKTIESSVKNTDSDNIKISLNTKVASDNYQETIALSEQANLEQQTRKTGSRITDYGING